MWGPAFEEEEEITKFQVFNFNDSGKIKVDSKSFTQGIVKNCYFISALRSLANNLKGVQCLRNCFDRMSDDDLKFSNEKTAKEKLNKVFTIGFYDIDFDDLSVDDLQHLGTMSKKSMVLKCKKKKSYYNVKCSDLVAAGIENKGNELWPLLIEHAWGMYLVHTSKNLGKRKRLLPFKYKAVTDHEDYFPEVASKTGDYTLISRYAENMYNSIAIASLTGKDTKILSIDLSKGNAYEQYAIKLQKIINKKVVTTFKDRTKDSKKFKDMISGKEFMLFSGHAVAIKDCFAKEGELIIEFHDTMNSVGENGIFHLSVKDFMDQFNNVASAAA